MKTSDFLEFILNKEIPLTREQLREEATLDPLLTTSKPASATPDDKFNSGYLKSQNAELLEDGYGTRGDERTPADMPEGQIPVKCSNKSFHYDLREHRGSSDCSGFISLSLNAHIARKFGLGYAGEKRPFYQYIAHYIHGLKVVDAHNYHLSENEVSATAPPTIEAYRQCQKKDYHTEKSPYICGSIFVKKTVREELQKAMIDGLLTPHEKAEDVQVKLKLS